MQETENNTQETFGVVDENVKENRQMNFQMMAPHGMVQESPSIGEEMSVGNPHLQPNISSSNLRGPLNFGRNQAEMQTTFAGIGAKIEVTENIEKEPENPPNSGF